MKKSPLFLRLFLSASLIVSQLFSPPKAQAVTTDPGEPYITGRIPNFAHPDVVKNAGNIVESQKDGNWLDVGMFDGPLTENTVVRINHDVKFNAALARVQVVSVDPGGVFKFSVDLNTRLEVTHFLIRRYGKLWIGSHYYGPVHADKKAEIVFRNVPINTTDANAPYYDPGQYGNGLLVFGEIEVRGAVKTPTFVRLAQEARVGDSSLTLAEPVTDWKRGDRLVLPDTRHLADNERGKDNNGNGLFFPQWEAFTLTSDVSEGTVLNITPALQFNHLGARDGNNNLEFLPHVGNLTRNVIFRSEDPAGTRGYLMAAHRAEVYIQYAQFLQMGRTKIDPLNDTTFDSNGNATRVGTNQNSRYPIHMSGVLGAPTSQIPRNDYQFTLIGNAIDGGDAEHRFKFGIGVTNSYFGLIQENVIYNAAGAGVGFWWGNPCYNTLVKNFCLRIHGNGMKGITNEIANQVGSVGTGFWIPNPLNWVSDNVAANIYASGLGDEGHEWLAGYSLYVPGGQVTVPLRGGNDPSILLESQTLEPQKLTPYAFLGNEVYGATAVGLAIENLGLKTSPSDVSKITGFRAWHFHSMGIRSEWTNHVEVKDYVARGNKTLRLDKGLGFEANPNGTFHVTGANVQGLALGLEVPISVGWPGTEPVVIEGGYLRNYTNISVPTVATYNSGSSVAPRQAIIQNVRFEKVDTSGTNFGGVTQRSISMSYRESDYANLVRKDEVFVYDYNQDPNADFQVFYSQQRPDFVVPQTKFENGNPLMVGSPEAGLTNLENWNKYNPDGTLKTNPNAAGLAIAGAITPCLNTTTYPDVGGYACSTAPDTTPPSTPLNLAAAVQGESKVDLTWDAATDPESFFIRYNVYRNGTNVAQVTARSYSDAGLTESTSYVYEVSAVNTAGLESAKSAAVTATTLGDTVLPQILDVQAAGSATQVVVVTFDEPVEEASAETIGNYAIDNGATISAASLGGDLKTVTLSVSPLSEGIDYILTVNNVRDRAATPNTILPNSQRGFTFIIVLDTTPPSAPRNLVASVRVNSRIDLGWRESIDLESLILYYNIYRNGTKIAQSISRFYVDTGLTESTSYTYEVSAVNAIGLESAKSAAATATTPIDTVAPQLLDVQAAGSPSQIVVMTFSEPMDEASAETIGNYTLDKGGSVNAASLGSDLKTVTLSVSSLSDGTLYTLTVNNVRDRAATPNTIVPNTQWMFVFRSNTVINNAPSVNAGMDKTVILPNTLALDGTSSDDGLPASPGRLTFHWEQLSGPGPSIFANISIEDTVVSFPAVGAYLLRLTASDGEKSSSDEITIAVLAPGSTPIPDPGPTQNQIPKFINIVNPNKGEKVILPLPREAEVEIYTKNGNLVKKLRIDGPGSLEWDCRNEDGKVVSSGVYLWKIKSAGGTETRKVVVVK